MNPTDRELHRGSDDPIHRDSAYFDERADRFRAVERTLSERACVSGGRNELPRSNETRDEIVESPAAYGTIDDVSIVPTDGLPEWYTERVSHGESTAQGIESCTLEASPVGGRSGGPIALLAADEYLRLDVLVDGVLWDTYVPVPRTPEEYEGSSLATLRERLDGRPIERFHCARMPIRYDDGRYVPDYATGSYDRWLRERGFVRWSASEGYELRPGLRVPKLVAGVLSVVVGCSIALAATWAFFAVTVPELFLVGLWYLLPLSYLGSALLARRVFRTVFGWLGERRRRGSVARVRSGRSR
ncbi:hypothetical protein [Natronorarus salvus]|uniref:hypothetical protein n=1 Tax=Natronorarus salvus TaxID=3117733 RepID=UPI002F26A91B